MPLDRPANMNTESTHLDHARTVLGCTVVSVGAGAVFNALPVILATMARSLGFGETEIGWLGSAELAGMLLGSCTTAWAMRFVSTRVLASLGVSLLLAATMTTFIVTTIGPACLLRALSGFGCGMSYSVAVAVLTRSSAPVRNVGILNAAGVIVGALELAGIPLLTEQWGFQAALVTVFSLVALAVLALPWIPVLVPEQRHAGEAGPDRPGEPPLRQLGLLALFAVTLFQTGPGVSWSYAESVAHEAGMSAVTVSIAFASASLVAATACLFAWRASTKFGQQAPLLLAMALCAAVMLAWVVPLQDSVDYVIRVTLSGTSWALVTLFQQTSLGAIDRTGRVAALVPAAQGLGQALGPLGGATLLALGFGQQHMLAGFVVPLSVSLLLCAKAHRKLTDRAPGLGQASA